MQIIATDFAITVDTVSGKVRIGFPFPLPWLDLDAQDTDNLVAAIQKHRASILPAPEAGTLESARTEEMSDEAIQLLNKISEAMKRSASAKPAAAT